MAKVQRETANDAVLLLDGKKGTALGEEPVLLSGEEMTVDDLLNCTVECLQSLSDIGLRHLIEHARYMQAAAGIELAKREPEGQTEGIIR
jgi:hypothetical protein